MNRRLCRHCNRWKAVRPRGLCYTCYYTPGVRDLYPSTSKFASKASRGDGNDDFCCPNPPLPEPTAARPGTPEKVGVFEKRAMARQNLWHPEDGGLS